jgi:hypothetical protein
MDPLRPIAPTDRTVPAVELTRLDPIERERDRQRRERERRRRQQSSGNAPKPRQGAGDEPFSGIDVRV